MRACKRQLRTYSVERLLEQLVGDGVQAGQPNREETTAMFIFYSIHFPDPEKEELLVQSMHEFGELMRKQPGILFQAPYPFKDPEKGTLMGISIWESEEAFQAALPTLQRARQNSPSHAWEVKPPEVYLLHSAV